MARRASALPSKPDNRVAAQRDRKPQMDQVKLDGVMKELVEKQEKTSQAWTARWDFLINPRQQWEAEAQRRGLAPNLFDKANKRRQPMEWGATRRPVAPLQPCDDPTVLSSGVIGWRARNNRNHLDLIAGPLFISPIKTADPPLRPNQPNLKHQHFIFLG